MTIRTEPDMLEPIQLTPLKVSDIKQFLYCPRILYFTYVAPVPKKVTFKMQHGKEQHVDIEGLEQRRTLRRYGLEQGVRHFGLSITSGRMGLTGKLDMAIETGYGWYPVDFKYTRASPGSNHRYQVAAYATLLEEEFGKPARAGFIYLVPRKEVRVVEITPGMRLHFRRLLTRIRNAVESGVMPPVTVFRGKCVDCEYRNYCADRWAVTPAGV